MHTERLSPGVTRIHDIITEDDVLLIKDYIHGFDYRPSNNHLGSLNYYPLSLKEMTASEDKKTTDVAKLFVRVLAVLNKLNPGYQPDESISCLCLNQGDAIAAHTDSYHAIHAVLHLSACAPGEGGDFILIDENLTVKPIPGSLIYFDGSSVFHEVTKYTGSVPRLAIRFGLYEKPHTV